MNQITTKEKNTLNQVSQQRDLDVKLGDLLSSLTGESITTGTPVNAVSATETLTLTGVVIDGETVSIGDDVYEFTSDALQTVTRPEFISVDIEASTTKSSGTLTMDTQPIAGDTVTIGTKVFTFVPVGTDNADGEVSVGADLGEAQVNLVAAINGTDGISLPHTLVSAADFAANDCIITVLIGGVAVDVITTTETFTAATNVFAAVTLGGGADCIAANAITALVAAITASDTQGVGAVDGAGDTVVLTSDLGGEAANTIALVTDMANATFTGGITETTLSGGVNGTVASGMKFLVDATYLYVCLDGNTLAQRNWRRISLGAAY